MFLIDEIVKKEALPYSKRTVRNRTLPIRLLCPSNTLLFMFSHQVGKERRGLFMIWTGCVLFEKTGVNEGERRRKDSKEKA
jgi:hypothetical protein